MTIKEYKNLAFPCFLKKQSEDGLQNPIVLECVEKHYFKVKDRAGKPYYYSELTFCNFDELYEVCMRDLINVPE